MRSKSRLKHGGFSTLEVLIALVLVAMAVLFTGRVIVATLAVIGRGNTFQGEKPARSRSEAVVWTQAVTEYTRKVGLVTLTTPPSSCCSFWISASSADPPYNGSGSPVLPAGFRCGHVALASWEGIDPNAVRLVTIEIYRVKATCADGGPEQPFIAIQTSIAAR